MLAKKLIKLNATVRQKYCWDFLSKMGRGFPYMRLYHSGPQSTDLLIVSFLQFQFQCHGRAIKTLEHDGQLLNPEHTNGHNNNNLN